MLQRNTSSHLYGFTDLKSLNERGPLVISYGKGIYVYDTKGNKYLDGNSGLWNQCAGFDHPGLIEVAKKQYEKFRIKKKVNGGLLSGNLNSIFKNLYNNYVQELKKQ